MAKKSKLPMFQRPVEGQGPEIAGSGRVRRRHSLSFQAGGVDMKVVGVIPIAERGVKLSWVVRRRKTCKTATKS